MGEIIWFPTAAINNYFSWENINDCSAKATIKYGKITASGIFYFNNSGDKSAFETERYYTRKSGATLEKWRIEIKEWKTFDGIRAPSVCEVTWKLKEGDFTWFKLRVTDVEYDTL
jgi:hypothetical protein